jgi:hypothetical protein
MKVIRESFNPDPAMDPSFYYESEDSIVVDNEETHRIGPAANRTEPKDLKI